MAETILITELSFLNCFKQNISFPKCDDSGLFFVIHMFTHIFLVHPNHLHVFPQPILKLSLWPSSFPLAQKLYLQHFILNITSISLPHMSKTSKSWLSCFVSKTLCPASALINYFIILSILVTTNENLQTIQNWS